MINSQIERDNEPCCGKTEALLVDDVLFNLIPLRVIMEDNFNTKCDEAVNGLHAVELYKQSM